MATVQNPIRKGFYPDPSICRGEEYYYCVHSTFSYAPGIPIFRSKDLIEWEQIGHALTRESQLNLAGLSVREGIYAPTIRYFEGVFYVIATNVGGGGTFYVTATDPAKEWSEPYFLKDAEGIDPSLFFEGNKCYCVGQRLKKKQAYSGDCEIWVRELDLKQHTLIGKLSVIWDGSMKTSIWDEGPHLYKKGDYYYLLAAEGGTAFSHSICVARSKRLTGPYEGCPNNPIFTHRHLGNQYPVQNTGHGDLVETANGDWYILMLGSRVLNGCAEMGRETFLADVTWQEGWPVINAGEGKLREFQQVTETGTAIRIKQNPITKQSSLSKQTPTLKQKTARNITLNDAIQNQLLLGLRQIPACYQQQEEEICQETDGTDKKGKEKQTAKAKQSAKAKQKVKTKQISKVIEQMELSFLPANLIDKEQISFTGIRMEERKYTMKAAVTAIYSQKEEAGLTCFYDEKNLIKLCVRYNKNQLEICILQMKKGIKMILLRQKLMDYTGEKKKSVTLKISGSDQKLTCYCNQKKLMTDIDTSFLCDQQTGGFTGTILGIYATSNHEAMEEPNKAVFSDWKVSFQN